MSSANINDDDRDVLFRSINGPTGSCPGQSYVLSAEAIHDVMRHEPFRTSSSLTLLDRIQQ